MGMKGYLKEVDVDTNQDGTFGNDDYEVVHLDGDSSKAVIGITFTTDSIPTINTKYDAKFSINVLYDIVNIGLHFILKNVRPYAAPCSEA